MAKKSKTKAKAKARAKPKQRKKLVASAGIKAAAKKSAARAAKGAPIRKGRASSARKAPTPVSKFLLHGNFASMPSSKVGLMLEMCGANWDYKHIDLGKGEHKTPEYLAMNRWGQVPVLKHGIVTLTQSAAILQYLAGHFGRFGGRSEAEKLRIDEWLAWELDFMATGIGMTRFVGRFIPHEEGLGKFMRARGERALDSLDKQLGTTKYVVGPTPTIADVAIFPWVAIAEEGGFNVANYPNVQSWAERMMTQPGVAHPYTYMPKQDRLTK